MPLHRTDRKTAPIPRRGLGDAGGLRRGAAIRGQRQHRGGCDGQRARDQGDARAGVRGAGGGPWLTTQKSSGATPP